jgi:lipopolysaccharide biosynthesis glycosyltransferase
MGTDSALSIFIGWDAREAVASEVAAHSIKKRTQSPLNIQYLKHRELSAAGKFYRPWVVMGEERETYDMLDGKKFSTEFSHTRFLVPDLMNYRGWALFMDADMVFMSDVKKLFDFCDDRYAAMVVKHNHIPAEALKMDGREQLKYQRKNWSSFVLWNCGHPANKALTVEKVNFLQGRDLHRFVWLEDSQIGSLPFSYNYISGVSPKIEHGKMPAVIHYTEGGPWFPTCRDVPYGGTWLNEYEEWQVNGEHITDVPSVSFERKK